MLLENKVAVIYGACGAIGSAVAKAFAREGARVFLSGRNSRFSSVPAAPMSSPKPLSPSARKTTLRFSRLPDKPSKSEFPLSWKWRQRLVSRYEERHPRAPSKSMTKLL